MSEGMWVLQLIADAARLFSLEPETLVLMLFSGAPATLDRTRTLAGPPPDYGGGDGFCLCHRRARGK